MSYDRFLIAPFSEGLITAIEPWLLPDEAFASLSNAYVWRGRVRKRFGGQLMGTGSISALDAPLLSRLRVGLGNTNAGTGNIAGTIGGIKKVGQQFSVSDTIFTIYNPAAGDNPMYSTNPAALEANNPMQTIPKMFAIAVPRVLNQIPTKIIAKIIP